MTRQAPIFPMADPLPRGPHRLSRAEVAAAQRARLMAAVSELVAERGYGAVTVTAICSHARISPNSFYQHYDSKLDCYLAAYEHFAGVLVQRLAAAADPGSQWEEFIAATLEVYLGSLEDDPQAARAMLIEGDGAGPRVRKVRRRAFAQLAQLIRFRHEQIRAGDPSLAELPERIYLGFVLGIRALVCEELEARKRPRLRALAPDLIVWLQAAVLGAAGAASAVAAD